ncbi:unnamed protein product [Ambrosiozyma monospora]|uniref:Unnamed protein product n=1 Tax=Ambrosiozyma monospora TaxID=43982 RepID=A0A9W6Z2U2_AMBMO|nr:unnamed protein product [Ambrosiozyma monospora]
MQLKTPLKYTTRPISLINISSKIFEELALRRMTYFIDQKPANQFGAQPDYNAIDPVLQFVYNIKHASGTGTARCVRQYASQEVGSTHAKIEIP